MATKTTKTTKTTKPKAKRVSKPKQTEVVASRPAKPVFGIGTWVTLFVLAALIGLSFWLNRQKTEAANEPTATPGTTSVFKESAGEPNESINNAAPVSTRFLKDGSFFRLNNLTLGYNLDTKKIGINNWISAARFSITGQNLWLITKYNGYDPEVNTDRTVNGISSFGIDYLSYPKARSFIFSLNLTF